MGVVLTVFDAFDRSEANFRLTAPCFLTKGVYTEICVKSVKYVKSDVVAGGVANL